MLMIWHKHICTQKVSFRNFKWHLSRCSNLFIICIWWPTLWSWLLLTLNAMCKCLLVFFYLLPLTFLHNLMEHLHMAHIPSIRTSQRTIWLPSRFGGICALCGVNDEAIALEDSCQGLGPADFTNILEDPCQESIKNQLLILFPTRK